MQNRENVDYDSYLFFKWKPEVIVRFLVYNYYFIPLPVFILETIIYFLTS